MIEVAFREDAAVGIGVHSEEAVLLDAFLAPVGPVSLPNEVVLAFIILVIAYKSHIQWLGLHFAFANNTAFVIVEAIVNVGADSRRNRTLVDSRLDLLNISLELSGFGNSDQTLIGVVFAFLLRLRIKWILLVCLELPVVRVEILQGVPCIAAITAQVVAVNELFRRQFMLLARLNPVVCLHHVGGGQGVTSRDARPGILSSIGDAALLQPVPLFGNAEQVSRGGHPKIIWAYLWCSQWLYHFQLLLLRQISEGPNTKFNGGILAHKLNLLGALFGAQKVLIPILILLSGAVGNLTLLEPAPELEFVQGWQHWDSTAEVGVEAVQISGTQQTRSQCLFHFNLI